MLRNYNLLLRSVRIPDEKAESQEVLDDHNKFLDELQNFERRHSGHHRGDAITFLAQRWQRIWDTDRTLAYPYTANFPSTQFCLQLAKDLCGPDENYYSYLMPTLRNVDVLVVEEEEDKRTEQHRAEYSQYVDKEVEEKRKPVTLHRYFKDNGFRYYSHITEYVSLSEIILTDDQHAVVVGDSFASAEKEGIFHYQNDLGVPKTLTRSEVFRIDSHSEEAKKLSHAIQESLLIQKRNKKGAALNRFISGLKENSKGHNGATEHKAGTGDASVVGEFVHFLDVGLSPEERLEFLAKEDGSQVHTTVQMLLTRAGGKAVPNGKELPTAYCTQEIATELEQVKDNNRDYFYVAPSVAEAKQLPDAKQAWNVARNAKIFRDIRGQEIHLARLLEEIRGFANEKDFKAKFESEANDADLVRVWKYLTSEQKNLLVEVLDKERLINVLQQQTDCYIEMDDAIHSLEQTIAEKGGAGCHAEADDVLKKAKAVRYLNVPVLVELLYRTAVGVRDPENQANRERYPEVIQEIARQDAPNCTSTRNSLTVSAMIFFGVLLAVGGVATLGILSGAAFVVGSGYLALCLLGIIPGAFLLSSAHEWGMKELRKKPVLADTGWAAARFCRNRLWSPPPAGPREARGETPARPPSDLTRSLLRA